MLGITLKENIGLGDKMQFASLPENYYRTFGKKLIDVSRAWMFDHNPFVDRVNAASEVRELWNFPKHEPWPSLRTPDVYLSNAELHAARFKAKVFINRPRLYHHELCPFEERKAIYLHTHGRSHGVLPSHIIAHAIEKYGPTGQLFHLGLDGDPDYGLPKIRPGSFWLLAKYLSQAKMLIGPDSGPAWVAACYPDVIVKKVRLLTVVDARPYTDWVPLEVVNHHSHWDDRLFQIYVDHPHDLGFMQSWKNI